MKRQTFDINSYVRAAALSILSAIFITGCMNEKRSDGIADPDSIYFDYQVSAEEGNDNLTILLQYRDGGEDDDPVSVGDATGPTLDGESIPADTTRSGDVFYELHKPIGSFAGKHQVVFKGADGKEYREEFNFKPLRLLAEPPDTIRRGDLVFEFEALDEEARIRILLTDTSFINDGINRVERIKGNRLVVSAAELDRLANGPVQLELIREFERDIKNGTGAGGRLLISYTLKREFFLAD